MDLSHGQDSNELFRAQSHIYKHVFGFANSMCLKCVVQLGIPDVIHRHKQPITLPELVSALQLPPSKAGFVSRLMRLMVHSGFFATRQVCINQQDEEGYVLTPSSKLLLKGELGVLASYVEAMINPALLSPWQALGDWFRGNEPTPFETAHGVSMWKYMEQNPEFANLLNEGMASDSHMMKFVAGNFKEIFGGLGSLVDVGGGTGTTARMILEAFPHIKCTVFDLPRVVAGLPESENLKYVGGDMFQSVPSADAILIKSVLHNWNDEDCVKVLKKCREAIPSKEDGGKLIIIDVVVNVEKDEHDLTETKLILDMLMMVVVTGKQRAEKEWKELFLEAGFSNYKITPTFGLRSVIEVYP